MSAEDIKPSELLAALDAFMADQKMTKGKAIRVLVTDMLTQLGYLASVSEERAAAEDLIYRSSNGDDWLLAIDNGGAISVIHRANPSSGGAETTTPLADFLKRDDGSPEVQAVRAAMNSAPPAGSHIKQRLTSLRRYFLPADTQ
jgi:hypothetical protein